MTTITDWTYDSTTSLGKLREKISDIEHGRPIFTNTELNNILSEKENDLNLSAAEALSRLLLRPNLLKRFFEATDLDNYSAWAGVINTRIENFIDAGGDPSSAERWDERGDRDIYKDLLKRNRL